MEPNKEQEILAAAEREFLNKGYDGARTTSIAQAAGVTHAMLHYYFHTKEQLFDRILDEKMQLMGQTLLSAFGRPGLPLAERVRNGIECHFDFVAAHAALPRFVINEIFSRPERYEAMRQRLERIASTLRADLQRMLDESADRGESERMDAGTLMLDIISLNLFVFIAEPLVIPLLGGGDGSAAARERFLRDRRAENIEIIMRRLKKR